MRSETLNRFNVAYLLLLAAVIIAVDVLLFRNRFWLRLAVNVGIVLVFAAFYFRFLRRQRTQSLD
jgi:membrane protein implicated in regulation of membrane protease activity